MPGSLDIGIQARPSPDRYTPLPVAAKQLGPATAKAQAETGSPSGVAGGPGARSRTFAGAQIAPSKVKMPLSVAASRRAGVAARSRTTVLGRLAGITWMLGTGPGAPCGPVADTCGGPPESGSQVCPPSVER